MRASAWVPFNERSTSWEKRRALWDVTIVASLASDGRCSFRRKRHALLDVTVVAGIAKILRIFCENPFLYPFHIILRSTPLPSVGRRSYRRRVAVAISCGFGIEKIFALCPPGALRGASRRGNVARCIAVGVNTPLGKEPLPVVAGGKKIVNGYKKDA